MTIRSSSPGDVPMPDPLAYFLTWVTYGTWLPGDERGWVEYRRGWKPPAPMLELEAAARMTEDACALDPKQRQIVEQTIMEHCQIRGWTLHALNCRTNHLHVVVSADCHPDRVREQFKAWCTRRLKEHSESHLHQAVNAPNARQNWWAERGSCRYINDDEGLEAAILYVRDCQDGPKAR